MALLGTQSWGQPRPGGSTPFAMQAQLTLATPGTGQRGDVVGEFSHGSQAEMLGYQDPLEHGRAGG